MTDLSNPDKFREEFEVLDEPAEIRALMEKDQDDEDAHEPAWYPFQIIQGRLVKVEP